MEITLGDAASDLTKLGGRGDGEFVAMSWQGAGRVTGRTGGCTCHQATDLKPS